MLSAAALALASGCKDEKPKQAAAPTQQVSRPASQPAAGGSMPHAMPTAGAPFAGKVTLDPSLPADAVRPSDVLFVMARASMNGQAGGLIATRRFAPVQLPLDYVIASQDVMVQGTPFTGPFVVHARLDRDGNPMTKDAEDLYVTYSGAVTPGQKGVDLVLTRGTPEQAPGAPAQPPGGGGGMPGGGGGMPGGAGGMPGHPGGAASQPAR